MGALPPVFIEFLGDATGFMTTVRGVKTGLAEVEASGGNRLQKLGAVGKAALLGIGVAAAATAIKTVHMAADFQTAMTRVETGAGESAKNMKMVSDGVLTMAGQVGQSTKQLTQGLYTVESAGYHGADALKVLRVSAMGAKVGAADLGTVTDAVTTAMNAYHLSASNAVPVMNALVATEAEGKTNMEALAGSMQGILPVSAAAHVGLNEVLGAMATMTAQGTPAAVAATYLRQTIGQLSNASPKAATTMKGLGLSAVEVAKELGSKGLAATLDTLTTAIKNKMGPSGTVLIDTLQKAAKNGKDFQSALQKTSGSQKTYIGALATMVGGTKSMMGALQLTGSHAKVFRDDIKGVAEHVKKGGKTVEGWAEVQKTFNQRMAEAKGSVEALGIRIGNALLPYATKLLGYFSSAVTWMAKHKDVAIILGAAIGSILALGIVVATQALWGFISAAFVGEAAIGPWVLLIMAVVAVIALVATHWKQIAAWLTSVWHSIVHGVGELWHWLERETLSVWHSIEGGITSAWHSVASFFSSAWHAVVDPIVNAWHWIVRTTTSIWNGIVGFFKKWWPLLLVIFLPFVALIVALWNHFHKQIEATAKAVWGAIKSFFVGAWKDIAGLAEGAWSLIKKYIVSPIEDAWHWMEGLWRTVSHWLSSQWQGIEQTASSLWGSIKRNMIQPLTDAWHSIERIMGQVKDAIANKLRDAWNSVKNVGSWFLSIGSDIVNGIINGIENAASGLFDSLKNLASDALSSAKSFLGINSPSRLFADHVGAGITEGIAKGIGDKGHLVHAAVRSVTGAALTVNTAGGGSFNLGTGTSATYGGSATIVNVHVEGSVIAEAELVGTIQREMGRYGARNSATYQPYRR